MKKFILALGLGLCAAVGASAQGTTLVSIDNETGIQKARYPIFTFGPEAGVQLSNFRAIDNGEEFQIPVRPAIRAGIVADLALTDVVSLQSGALFSRKAYLADQTSVKTISRVRYREETQSYFTVNYLEIPLTLQYKFAVGNVSGLFAGAGLYGAVAFGGDIRSRTRRYAEGTGALVSAENARRDVLVGRDRGDDIASTDLGLNVNAGYFINEVTFVRAHSAIGLKNLSARANTINSLRNFSFGVTVGLLF
ncbi:MAG: PorT family protein [Sphingobacteriales bacterium]|nr:MAG: PorT family protein [Sphingobacteriales bacterium]